MNLIRRVNADGLALAVSQIGNGWPVCFAPAPLFSEWGLLDDIIAAVQNVGRLAAGKPLIWSFTHASELVIENGQPFIYENAAHGIVRTPAVQRLTGANAYAVALRDPLTDVQAAGLLAWWNQHLGGAYSILELIASLPSVITGGWLPPPRLGMDCSITVATALAAVGVGIENVFGVTPDSIPDQAWAGQVWRVAA
jgi:hypothetical protein